PGQASVGGVWGGGSSAGARPAEWTPKSCFGPNGLELEEMNVSDLKPGVIVRGPVLPEPTEVLVVTPLGDVIKLTDARFLVDDGVGRDDRCPGSLRALSLGDGREALGRRRA